MAKGSRFDLNQLFCFNNPSVSNDITPINTRTVITIKDFIEFKRNSDEESTWIQKVMLSQNRAAQKL